MRRWLSWGPQRGRLAFRQVVVVGVGTAVLAALAAGFAIHADLRSEQEKLRVDIDHMLELVRGPATEAAFALDPSLAQSVVEGLLRIPAIAEVRIVDDFRQPLAEARQRTRPVGLDAIDAFVFGDRFERSIVLVRVEGAANREVGKLLVAADPFSLANPFFGRAVRTGVLAIAWSALIATMLFLVLYFLTTRPLMAISQALAEIDPHAPAARRLAGFRLHRDDEIGGLVDSINGLLQSTDRSIAEAGRAAAALGTSEARLSAIMNHATAAISIKDMLGRYIFVNRRFEAVFQAPAGEVLGKTDGDLFPADVAERLRAEDAVVVAGGKAVETEEELRRVGPARHYLTSRFPLFGADGRAYAVCAIATDTTERRQLEQQLRQAQKMEAIGQLTGGIAHDFNNLLTVILGNAELLESELGSRPDLKQMAGLARQAAERGAQLTKRLLAFSRRQPLDARRTDVTALVHGMGELLRRALGEQVTIDLALKSGTWPALVDPTQLEAALLNLAVNARDAMQGGGRLTIEAGNVRVDAADPSRTDIAPGEYVMVAVSDTGIGMTQEVLARAFEPFFTTKEVGKGTGLGLSMVYGFVRQSGGHVRLHSEPGHGTAVKIYLPRAGAADTAPASAAAAAAARSGGETVLVVEDNELVRPHVERLLKDLGYRVIAAPDGPQALDAIRRTPGIDLLFTDMVMPGGMDGLRLAEEARRLKPALRVLLTSGFTEAALASRATAGGDVQVLAKPYRRQDLATRVRQILDAPPPRAD